ncbi:MAG TPA: SgcJ/EcaC family oxidoreductase [Modestobacter sp.]|nr:SgcJ/EcaC family oxidoreductase [Modestobacter sp.]
MAIEDLAQELVGAFNAKDPDAFAALFSPDAEFVNVFGARMRGRAGIDAGHRQMFATALRGSTLTAESLETMQLGPDAAVCHLTWARGRDVDATPATLPPGRGVFTLVGQRTADGWQLAAATNVAITVPGGALAPRPPEQRPGPTDPAVLVP